MSQSLFSQSWFKVCDLKVRLRQHTNIHRHQYRGKVWFVLQDHMTGKLHRFSPQAYQLIGLMNGERTLQQIWDNACQILGDELPTQDEVIQIVGQLNKANAIQTDVLPSIAHLQQRQESETRKKWLQQLKSPLSVRLPLLDPEKFLHRTRGVAKIIFSPFGALVWLSVVIMGGLQAVTHWEALTQNLSDQVLGLENLVLMALVYPVVKLAHELGHGYAVKRWGGEVHEMGVMFLIFIPVPYVDASAASSFRSKYQRMMVGAVGVLGELFLAALAMIVWALAEPGLARALAYNVMLIGGVSTLLFNGNPLLRFDAYYVLADFLEIPNLASRGNAQVGYVLKRYLFRLASVRSNAHSRKESLWMVGYACAAYLYRLFVMVAISLFVASHYFIVGILLAMWSVWSSLILPVLKVVSSPLRDPVMQNKKPRIYVLSTLVVGSVLGALFLVPAPYKTYVHGVLNLPQSAMVRSEVNGFVDSILINEGEQVAAGAPLVKLQDPDLLTRSEVIAAQLQEAQLRAEAAVGSRSEADILEQEVRYLKQAYEQLQQQISALTVTSPTQGQFILPAEMRQAGRFVYRGDVVAFLVDYNALPLTTMISEDDIDRVRSQTRAVEVKLSSLPDKVFSAQVLRQVPASTNLLPSSVLSVEAGGLIALDPNREQELQAFESYYLIELGSQQLPRLRFDERVHVLFTHDPEPIAYRWYRAVRRVFLRQFNV